MMQNHGTHPTQPVAPGALRIRPDLSNDAIEISTGENAMRCVARPRKRLMDVMMGAAGMLLSFLPLLLVQNEIRRLMTKPEGIDVIAVMIVLLPATVALVVFVRLLVVRRRICWLEIAQGVVTLHTPDTPVSLHQFDRSNLAGARLSRPAGSDRVDLAITRHHGGATVVFRGYHPQELTPTHDAVNAMVLEHHEQAFEVIVNPPPRPAE